MVFGKTVKKNIKYLSSLEIRGHKVYPIQAMLGVKRDSLSIFKTISQNSISHFLSNGHYWEWKTKNRRQKRPIFCPTLHTGVTSLDNPINFPKLNFAWGGVGSKISESSPQGNGESPAEKTVWRLWVAWVGGGGVLNIEGGG